MPKSTESLALVKGTLDMLVLKALSWGPMHGYGIASWLETCSQGNLSVEDSALYQALHRLEARRLVNAEWRMTENKRRARFYRITQSGRQYFESQTRDWELYTKSISQILAANSFSS